VFICNRPLTAVLAALAAGAAFVVTNAIATREDPSMAGPPGAQLVADRTVATASVEPRITRPARFPRSLVLRSSDRDSPGVTTPRN
jgi:hypothetical protein